MVSLAATGRISPEHNNLRSLSFWYPRIPEKSLYLNEGSFTARENAMTRYEPICWTRFAGPAGMYLRLLTGISVITDPECPRAVEFQYNSPDVPVECRNVGSCTPSDYTQTLHFDIDGPGGEVINSLTVYVRQHSHDVLWYYKPEILESFKASSYIMPLLFLT